MTYLLARPDRYQFDWLFIGYNSMSTANLRQPLPNLTDEERELLTKASSGTDMQTRKDACATVGRLIGQITEKLANDQRRQADPVIAATSLMTKQPLGDAMSIVGILRADCPLNISVCLSWSWHAVERFVVPGVSDEINSQVSPK